MWIFQEKITKYGIASLDVTLGHFEILPTGHESLFTCLNSGWFQSLQYCWLGKLFLHLQATHISYYNCISWSLTRSAFFVLICSSTLMAQMVKHLTAMQETWVWSLGREDPLEEEMETHSSTPAWKIPWMEEPSRL